MMPVSSRNPDEEAAASYVRFQDLEECLQKSHAETVFILKHSRTCPVSAYAKREVDVFLRRHPATVYLVVVQDQRAVSNAIAGRLHIQHESPQVLCLRDGRVQAVYNHYRVTADALQKEWRPGE